MRFAISIPQFAPDGAFAPGAFRAYLERAETLGFDGAWVGEQVVGTIPHLDPLETLAYAAACTDRIRLGCSSLVLPLYSPVHLAKSLSSLDQMSRGRLDIGITLGGRFRPFPHSASILRRWSRDSGKRSASSRRYGRSHASTSRAASGS